MKENTDDVYTHSDKQQVSIEPHARELDKHTVKISLQAQK